MSLLIYGANGYTGALVAERAVARGLKPILAGRNAEAVAPLAHRLGLAHRAFGLDAAPAIDAALAGVRAVLSCAGPFAHTAAPLVEACLRARVHYLDVAGEVAVFESLAARSEAARAAGVMLMPGVGFGVVPSDCLAAHLASRLPSATHLALAFEVSSRPSRGTARSMVEHVGGGGLVRRDGKLVRVPAGWRTRTVDFGAGPRTAITIPWGDLSTAYHTTGIPNIEVYVVASAIQRWFVRLTRVIGPVLAAAPIQRLLKAGVRARPPGPSEEERARGVSRVWGEARDDEGRVVTARLRAPEAYELTRLVAVAICERVMGGEAPGGFQTPARAYGKDMILGFPGVVREDLDAA